MLQFFCFCLFCMNAKTMNRSQSQDKIPIKAHLTFGVQKTTGQPAMYALCYFLLNALVKKVLPLNETLYSVIKSLLHCVEE